MQRLDGRLREVVAYESRTARLRANFLSQQKMEWYMHVHVYLKINYESLLSPAN